MFEILTCQGCYFLNNPDSDGLKCAEISITNHSMRCRLYASPEIELSETAEAALLQDLGVKV